jgi:glutathione synthase/RimK-type ligase-like ATP-grasp enzyme
LVIAQDFLKSTFDWRVGVLDSKPLFACKYYMAKNHWQILNWNAKKKRDFEGNVETLSVEMVPKNVLSTAVKAASVMGDGFYGVDLKEIDGKVYVIEVNDNPNVDYRHEDIILENELYLAVMKSLFNRIESQRSVKRTISKEK